MDEEIDAGKTADNGYTKRRRASSHQSTVQHFDTSPSPSVVLLRASIGGTETGASHNSFYWDGELRQTANIHVEDPEDKPVFNLADILSPVRTDRGFIFVHMLRPRCVVKPRETKSRSPSSPLIVWISCGYIRSLIVRHL